MNNILISTFVLGLFISCNNKEVSNDENVLRNKYDSLDKEHTSLKHKFDSLMSALDKSEFPKSTIKKDYTDSGNVLSKYNIGLRRVKTGYIASKYENLFLPSITIDLKNLSEKDIREMITIRAFFIYDGEQLSSEVNWFSSENSPFIGGLSRLVTFSSSIGWNAIVDQKVKVKIYVNDELIQEYKIDNKEYFGRF